MTISSAPAPAQSTALPARRDQLAERQQTLALLSREWNHIGNLRLLLFAAAAALALWWWFGDATVAGIIAIPVFLAFIVFVIRHRAIGRKRRRAQILTNLSQETVWRLERDWEQLPLRSKTVADAQHAYAADLDLFGRGSLLHLIDRAVTPAGRQTMADWLQAPAEPGTIAERQAAVRELAGRDDLREQISLEAQLTGAADADPSRFIEWATGEPVLAKKALVRAAGIVLPICLIVLVIAELAGAIGLPLWIVPLALNLLITQAVAGETTTPIERAGGQRETLRAYAAVLRAATGEQFSAKALIDLQQRTAIHDVAPPAALDRLARIARWWIPRSSIAYLPANAFFAWDINYLGLLERWQAKFGALVPEWLEATGEIEALSSLAALAADHPDWSFPAIAAENDRFAAVALGHPLLPDDQCVRNDVTVGPAGTFLLVTGSNMSGKSTLLRSIGATIVLAQAGGPVCAQSLSLPPCDLWTSMRVHDSLQQGVSFFMAELLRLKQIIDAVNVSGSDGRTLFYILDEMLQGTNTAERQIAARRIIRHLVDRNALGAVSTHDLTLADGPELAASAEPVHLTETVEDDAMVFDYRLRPGIATSTNALKLMDVVGFDFDGSGSAHHLHIKRDYDSEPDTPTRPATTA